MTKPKDTKRDERVHNPHDFFFKLCTERIRDFSIFLYGLLLPVEIHRRCDWGSLIMGSGSVYDSERELKIDAVPVVDYRRDDGLITPLYLPTEHKSYVDNNLPLQLAVYETRLYDKLRSLDNKATILAIPSAIYLGAQKWEIPTLRESLLRSEATSDWGELASKFPRQDFCRLHAWELDEEFLLSHPLGVIIFIAIHASNLTRDKLIKLIRSMQRMIKARLDHYLNYVLDYLQALGVDIGDLLTLEGEISSHLKKGDLIMPHYAVSIDDARAEGLAEGEAKGKAEGKAEEARNIALRMLKSGKPEAEITEMTGLSRKELVLLKRSLR